MGSWKDKFKFKPLAPEMKYRRIDKYIFPDSLIKQAGKNPEDFPECHPPTQRDIEQSILRIRHLSDK